MSTNPNYLGPFRNRFPLNLYRKLPLVNSYLSLNQSETVFKIKFWSHYILNLWFLNINRSMSEWICPKRQKKRRLVYVMTTHLRQHGLMSFISLNIPEREINLHFVNSAGLQKNAPFCVLLKKTISGGGKPIYTAWNFLILL